MAQWSLQQRLEEAEAQRRLAAGLAATADDTLMERPIGAAPAPTPPPAADAPPAPAPAPAPTDVRPPSPDTIDLREPLAPWQRPEPAPAVGDPDADAAADDEWRANALAPRAAAAISLPVWQGASGATPTRTRAAASTEQVATRRPTKDRCPHCGGKVRLDRFDLVDAVAHMTCTDCGFRYQAKSPKG